MCKRLPKPELEDRLSDVLGGARENLEFLFSNVARNFDIYSFSGILLINQIDSIIPQEIMSPFDLIVPNFQDILFIPPYLALVSTQRRLSIIRKINVEKPFKSYP